MRTVADFLADNIERVTGRKVTGGIVASDRIVCLVRGRPSDAELAEHAQRISSALGGLAVATAEADGRRGFAFRTA